MGVPTHYIKRRDFLHSEKTSPAALSQAGREYLAQERYSDALDCFEKSGDTGGVKQIKQIALKGGDTFLLARLDRFDRTMVSREDWETAAKSAESAGRPSMAAFVVRKFAAPPGPADKKPAEKPGEAPLAEV